MLYVCERTDGYIYYHALQLQFTGLQFNILSESIPNMPGKFTKPCLIKVSYNLYENLKIIGENIQSYSLTFLEKRKNLQN